MLAAYPPSSLAAQQWQLARPGYQWSFPRDHWAHPAYKTEWWYFTGRLVDVSDTTRSFGYQFTFFRVGVMAGSPRPGSNWAAQMLVMGHAAIGDFGARRHQFSEVLYRAVPRLGGFGRPGDSLLAWSRGPAGTGDLWTLRWNGSAFEMAMADARQDMALTLIARTEREVVLQGPGGLSLKGADSSASLYYSFTRLATEGTLRAGGRTYQVRGRSWMDKEFGSNQLAPSQRGWDWFSLQLDDGRDLMLYLLRDSSGSVNYAHGTLVQPSGSTVYLAPQAFTVRASERWRSDSSGAEYPARWDISVPAHNITIEVRPVMADQENRSAILPRLFYWEGAVDVRANGRHAGQGYVELVGYGSGARPAL